MGGVGQWQDDEVREATKAKDHSKTWCYHHHVSTFQVENPMKAKGPFVFTSNFKLKTHSLKSKIPE